MHPVPRALQQTIVRGRPYGRRGRGRLPQQTKRGFVVQLSDQATMVGDLSGVARARDRAEAPDPRLAKTQIFIEPQTVHEHPVTRPRPTVLRPPIPPPVAPPIANASGLEEHPLIAAAYGFFAVLAVGAPILIHLFAG